MSKETTTDGGEAIANERQERGQKMLVPKTWTKEKAAKKEAKAEVEIPEKEIIAITSMDAPKHYRMWLLHKKGMSRKRIAELLTTNKNEGQVGNALKLYIGNPEKEKEVEAKLKAK